MYKLIFGVTTLGLSLLHAFAAAPSQLNFQTMSSEDAERALSGTTQMETSAAAWIWADKVVYQANEALTLRWTIKPNNDLYPYTIVAFRQNNQTGSKSYFPGNSETVTDIFGNTIEQGFRITRLPEATKGVLIGTGGTIMSSALTLPSELGMHTMVVQLRDYTGTRVVKSAYFKFGIVSGYEDLPSAITESRTLSNEKAYRIKGIVSVRNNAILSIMPGTFVIGQPGSQPPSVLLITTAGKLVANGTRSRPIIFTSSQPVGSRVRGDWGGLILLGKAPLNDASGALSIEGLPELDETKYGGKDSDHNCGYLRYVRVEFAGALLRPNEETNGITWGACGNGTVGEFLQSHYGLDDNFEWFGGNNSAKYLVSTYPADDHIDVQIGYSGSVQHVVAVANDDLSNRGIEADNYEKDFAARPLGKPQMWNMTFVGGGTRGYDETNSPCLYFRRGAGGSYNNIVCYNWITRGFGADNFDSISPNITSGDFSMNGILLYDNGKNANRVNTLEGQILESLQPFAKGDVGQGKNFLVSNPMMRRPLERNDPDFRPLLGSPLYRANWVQPPDNGFFDQWANWIGAFGEVNWTEEWTNFLQEQDIKP
jgi:hypothetical protein